MKNIISRISFFFMCFFAFPVHSQDEQDRPSKPTDLQATPGNGQVTLRWSTPNDNGSPIIHYEYRQRVDEDNASWDPDWTQIPDSDAQTTSYTRDNLTNGTTYRFRVRAVNEVGEGRGALVLATPVQPNRPPELAGPSTVLLDENSTDAVATYEAIDPDDDELTWTLAGADASAFQLQGSGTTRTLHFQEAPDFETQPTYAVDVVVADDGALSATVSVSVLVTVSNVDELGTVVLSTTQSRVGEPVTATLTDPDGRMTHVLWTWLQDGTASEEAGTSEGLSSTFTPTQAMVGTRLQARAHYEDGQGTDKSVESAPTEPVIGRPSRPRSLSATPGDGQVTLSWSTPNDNGSPITHYKYRHRIDEDNASWDPDWTQIPGSDAQTTSYTIDNLTNGTTYRFRVHAVNEVGAGRGALVLAMPVQPNRPPELAGPSTVLLDENSTDAVATYEATDPDDDELTWTLAGADASAFRLDHDASGTTSTLHFQEAPDFETQPTYAVEVVVADDGALSATVSVLVIVSNVDELGTVVLSTTQSRVGEPVTATLTDPDGRMTHVLWTWLQDGTASEEAGTSEGLSSTFTPTQAMVGTRLQARAHYEDGQGTDKSVESAPTEPVIGRPSRPRSLSATPGDGQVTLSWSTPNDNGSPITHYKYRHRIDEDNASWDPDWTQIPGSDAQTTSYTIDNLTNGTTYRFRVHAVNEVGAGRGALVLAMPVQPNRPPELAGPSTVLLDENSTDAVATYEATDPDDDELTWTLAGADASAFRLDHDASGTTSTLHFQEAPDFETQPTYAVEVVVADDGALSATVSVLVIVSNVDELGTVVLSTTQSRVGEPITATLTDPDGRMTHVLWTWLQDGTASEEAGTSEGLSSTFTPTQAMVGTRLQARAHYEDGQGTDKSVESAPTEPVIGRPDQPSLSATPGNGLVTLRWSTPNDNGSPIIHYEYRQRVDEDNASWDPDWTQIPDSDAQTTSYTRDELTNGAEYTFEVRAVNEVGEGKAGHAAAMPVQPNRPPELAGPSSASVDENSTDAVATYEATDPDDDELTWTLAGADASAFQLQGSGTTSTLHFQEAPDFETQPSYAVEVVVADDGALSATVSVLVTVSNVDELGTVVLSTTQPRVGEPVTATLTDPDGRMTNVQWLSNYRRPLGPRQRGASSEGASRADQFSDTLRVTPKKRDVGRKLQMEAVYDDVHGANKSVLSVWTEPVIDRPDPPSLSAMSGSGQVTLSWTTPNDNGSPITHYEYRQRNDGTTWDPDWTQIAGSDAQTTRYPIDNLTNGTTYTFEVRAVNAVGAGEAARVSVAPGFTVRNLSASAGDEQVVLRWEAPLSDGGSPITGYEYRYSSNSHDTWTASEPAWADVTGGSSARSQTVSSLTNGTEYTFEVRAVNAAGASPASRGSATPVTVPEAVVNLEAMPSPEQVVLRWEVPLSDGGAAITGYEYRYSSDSYSTWTASEPAWTTVSDGVAARSQTVSSLTNGTEYTFEVRAVNSVGASPASRGSATPATVPEAVVNFEATPSDEQIVLSWEAPASNGGTPITHYQYRYSSNSHDTWTASEPAWADVTGGSSARSQTVSSLTNDTEYTFEVRAVNAAGEGPASRVSATPAVSKPGAVRNLSASAGDEWVTLYWDAPLSDGGSPITHYRYRRDGESWATVSGGASARSKTESGLTNGTTYTFYVRAVNSVGGGSFRSIMATPISPPEQPEPEQPEPEQPEPEQPEDPKPDCVLDLSGWSTHNQVSLSWSTSNCEGIDDYTVNGTSVGNTTNHTESGLESDTEYDFTVCAKKNGESLACESRTFITGPDPPRPCPSGSVSLTSYSPQVGVPLTATLTDPDGGITGASWSWGSISASRSEDDNSPRYPELSSYTPTTSDVGSRLYASVSYRDNCRPDDPPSNSASSFWTSPVTAASAKPVSLQAMPDSVLAAIAAPNPFNPTTTLHIQLPASGPVSLTIYNMAGQVVRTLWDDHELEAGYHTIDWDSRDQQGHPVTSGVYLYQLRTSKHVLMNKMVLIR